MQVRLLRRDGAPSMLARDAVKLIYNYKDSITPTLYEQSESDIATFLRCCATILKHTAPPETKLANYAIHTSTILANNYLTHVPNNVNELCHVLRSIIALQECKQVLQSHEVVLHQSNTFTSQSQELCNSHDGQTNNNNNTFINTSKRRVSYRSNNNDNSWSCEPMSTSINDEFLHSSLERNMPTLEQLITPAFQLAFDKWKHCTNKAHVISLLSMLKACSIVYGSNFRFASMHTNMFGLLPCKSKMQMEAKLQRCYGARELLTSLREVELTRIDAGMCLAYMAETGLYDPVVCDASCSTLRTNKDLITSQQWCEVIYNLGVLQHRHIHQHLFSNAVDAKKCNAEAIREHIVGLAMLRQPPHNAKTLIDGVFLHALRAKRGHSSFSSSSYSTTSTTTSNGNGNNTAHLSRVHNNHKHNNYNNGDRKRSALGESFNSQSGLSHSANLTSETNYVLHPLWYVDVSHALTCMQITHHKFQLMTARQVRSSIHLFSTLQRCRLLYGIGGVTINSVPSELISTWRKKVIPVINITADKLKEVPREEKPYVMNALLHCNIKEHTCLHKELSHLQQSDSNPVETLLRTWPIASREHVMKLIEQINSTTLANEAAEKLAAVIVAIANTLGNCKVNELYRFSPLCALLDVHANEMSISQLLNVINAFIQIHLHFMYERTLISLLNALRGKQEEFSDKEKYDCARIIDQLQHLEIARSMLSHLQRSKV